MPWGFVAAAAIGAVGSMAAGHEQAAGEEQAAKTQAGTEAQIMQTEAPYVHAGNAAETTLQQLLGTSAATGAGGTAAGTTLPGGYLTEQFNPTQAQLDAYPGYEYQLNTGAQSVENAMAPGQGAMSGAGLKQLMSTNQGIAASNYNNYFNQFQTQQNNIYSRLQGIAQLGQAAAGGQAAAQSQLGTGIAGAEAGAAASEAGGIVGATNALGNSAIPLAYMMGGNSSGFGAVASYYGNAADAAVASQIGYPASIT